MNLLWIQIRRRSKGNDFDFKFQLFPTRFASGLNTKSFHSFLGWAFIFCRWLLKPRVLRDVSVRNLSTFILGKPVSFPLGISPSAMQKLAHPDGELAMVKGT